MLREIAGTRVWVYPQSVKGKFQRIHRWTGAVLLAILFVTPWIRINGHPALLLDLPARRLYAFGGIFTPTDTILLVLVALFLAFSLFFFTSLFGRLWCGYACPQTVFLEELVRPIETWLEGERGVRMHLDKQPWTPAKIRKKVLKWTAFAVLAIVVAMGFMSLFVEAPLLWTGQASGVAYVITGAFAVTMFLDFTWFREQFCNYLCPYARFQGALCDDQSLVVAYDEARGEPARGTGECIDCKKCVTVCPAGIDIRKGFQLECITCARCVDACEGVMAKLGKPTLIDYRTQAGGEIRWIRGRTIAYGFLLTGIAAAFVGILLTRHDISMNVARAPGTLFVVDDDGWVRNTFLVRLTSNQVESAEWELRVEGLPEGATFTAPPVTLASGQSITVPLVVRVPPPSEHGDDDRRDDGRTLPVRVIASSEHDELVFDTTVKTMGT